MQEYRVYLTSKVRSFHHVKALNVQDAIAFGTYEAMNEYKVREDDVDVESVEEITLGRMKNVWPDKREEKLEKCLKNLVDWMRWHTSPVGVDNPSDILTEAVKVLEESNESV